MTALRRKLTSTFLALGVLGLLVIGVTSYAVVQWRQTEQTLAQHYSRSLRLQEVRALTFQAFKEVPDAVVGGDEDPRKDYARRLEPLDRTFQQWIDLAEDDAERRQVAEVRQAAQRLDASADEVFDLVDAGRVAEATQRLEAVEETAFEPFNAVTSAAVDSDRRKRSVIRSDAESARRTATLTLAVAGVGVLSLLLLVGAYLSGGVFTPVRRLSRAMRTLSTGDTSVRVPEQGDDELGELYREFNVLAGALQHHAGGGLAVPGHGVTGTGPGAGPGAAAEDAQLVLGRLVGGVREQAERLGATGDGQHAPMTATLLGSIDALAVALARVGGLAYPVELRVAPVEPAALLHEVLDRFSDEVVRRSVSTQIAVDADLGPLQVDRARLRETLGELVRNALDALPPRGGRLSLRVRQQPEGARALEVEDDGSGISEDDVAWLYDGSARPRDTRGVGLRLATAVVEQHGGRLQLETLTAGGTVARILLPAGPAPAGAARTSRPSRRDTS